MTTESLIIRALMNTGLSYREAVIASRETLPADSRVALIRLAACASSPVASRARQEFARRIGGGINRF